MRRANKKLYLSARVGVMRRAARLVTKAVVWLAVISIAVIATIIVGFAVQARLNLPELRPWHKVGLTEEFRAARADAPRTFDEYRSLEDRLFAELRTRVLDDPAMADSYTIGRFNPKSVPARLALETPYNRSFELVPERIRGGVLLVHGLTDSPYMMRGLAELFYQHGFYVLALRLPGHGTAPAGLVDVHWQD